MTGRYPHAHGAYRNDISLHPDEFTLGNMFQQAGYETGYAGKWHLDGKNNPTWPDWIPAERSFGFQESPVDVQPRALEAYPRAP